MKANTHPDYHEITVVMTNGVEYTTRSTWGKKGDKMILDVDPHVHPAWTGGTGNMRQTGQMEKFNNRFGGLSFGKKANG